jgi:flagellar protein FliT
MAAKPDMQRSKPAEILKAYENLADVTGRMRVAASNEDWDAVIALETECAKIYTKLTAIEAGAPYDDDYQRRKSELICKLLDDDAQIRNRVSGQLTRIWQLIDGRPAVERLSSAYGASGAAGSIIGS